MKRLFNREMAFLALIIGYVTVLFACSDGLSPKAKVMPTAVGIICLILIALEACSLLFSKDKEKSAVTPAEKFGEKTRRSIIFILWMITFGVAINVFGFLLSLAIWLFALLFFVSKASLKQSILITAVALLFIYVVFVKVLMIRFPLGVFFG